MKSFINMGVRGKFQLIMAISFFLIGLFLFFYFPLTQRTEMTLSLEQKAKVINQMVAQTSGAGLVFEDASSVSTLLEAFKEMRDVEFAVVLKKDRSKFSAYQEDKYIKYSNVIKELLASKTNSFSDDNILIELDPIMSNNEKVGEVVLGMSKAKIVSEVNSARITAFIISLIIFILGITTMRFFFNRTVFNPIGRVLNMARELQKGHIKARADVKADDEIGTMAKILDQFAAQIDSNLVGSMVRIADGDISFHSAVYDQEDEIAPVINKLTSTIREVINESKLLVNAATEGKLSVRGNADKFNGGYKEIIQGLNDTLDAIVEPIEQQSIVLEKIANGDLTARMSGSYKGDFSKVKSSINSLAESFSYALSDVAEAVKATGNSSSQISFSAEKMASGAQEQSAQTSEVAVAVEQMTRTILETTKNASAASENAKRAGIIAEEGGEVVEATVVGMKRISEVVSKASETVKQLGNSSNQIGEIIQVIDEIADQTNLLALNAAIEAARAGEMGRGFAVVADEVRKLAERTTKATKEIADKIKQIQMDTKGAVDSIEEGTIEVKKGSEMANKAGESLREIIRASNKVVVDIDQVAGASQEQSSTAEQISKSIETISSVSNESAEGTQMIAKSAEDLNNLTDNLQKLVNKFKIEKSEQHYSIRQNGKLIRK